MPRTTGRLFEADHAGDKPLVSRLADFAQKLLIGRHKPAVELNCQRKVEAIRGLMIELDGDSRCSLEQRACRLEFDIRGLKQPSRENRFVD